MPRRPALGLCLLLLLAGCSSGDPDRNAVAAAKCSLPLSQRLQVPQDQRLDWNPVTVRDLGGGRREVTGQARLDPVTGDGPRSWPFTCVVVPDAADRLRGLRLESLDVPGSLEAWRGATPAAVVRGYVDALSIGDLELARALSTPAQVARVASSVDSWYRNVVSISDLALGTSRPERGGVFVPVTFSLLQRRALSLPDGDTTWGYRLVKTGGRWLIADEGPV